MDEYIEVKIDVFEYIGQRARVRKSLTVGALIEEIIKEFDDVAGEAPETYAIYLKNIDRPLATRSALAQFDIQPHDELIFKYLRQTNRRMLDPQQYAFLRDETNGRLYEIQWQPAIIGRPNTDAEHNINLAVNLQSHPKGLTISRKHAQITFAGGHYYLESLADKNPVAVNGKQAVFGIRQELKSWDKVSIGHKGLQMTFIRQADIPAALRTAAHSSSSQANIYAEPKQTNVPEQKIDLPLTPEKSSTIFLIVEQATDTTRIGERMKVESYPSIIGRDTPLFSAEKDVSRRHIELNYDPATHKFIITDLESRNGVFINNIRIDAGRPYEIKPGTRLGLGSALILRLEV